MRTRISMRYSKGNGKDDKAMLVLGVNKILKWCQITTGGRRYTCPTKEINGELCFIFKKAWHPAAKYISEHTEELIEEGGKVLSRPIKK